MKKVKELPLVDPIYSTYHHAPGSAVIKDNPSIRNFYLNQVMNIRCTRRFLSGLTTPQINIIQVNTGENPYLDRKWRPMKYLDDSIHSFIRDMIDEGYYVCFTGVDDYYVKGKSWYKERHFNHDGCICGYNQEDKTYCIYAYDINWIYQKFWTPQAALEAGRKAMVERGVIGDLFCVKPKSDIVDFQPKLVLVNMKEYLDSSLKKYPKTGEGEVHGIAVHDYIAMYVDKLYDGSIPYERMDRRVFRLIWEHKKAMLERLEKMEITLGLNNRTSTAYKRIVAEADKMRMLYASHHMRRRDAVLPVIHTKLIDVKKRERELLKNFIKKAERKMSE